jgi:hypothetical protein
MTKLEKYGNDEQYTLLLNQISELVTSAKRRVASTVNSTLVETYWGVGKYIVEFEQQGNARAKYGDKLLVNLSKDLTLLFGKGYSKSNLFNMRLFYTRFPIFQTVSGKLTWSHIIEIISIDNKLERDFYLAETVNSSWAVRDLRWQKERGLFLQLALGKSKEQVVALSQSGNIAEKPEDIIIMYLGYFAIDKNNEGDNPPIGIILAKEKDEVMVQYAMYGNNSNLFVSKYQLYLPDVEELRKLLFQKIEIK